MLWRYNISPHSFPSPQPVLDLAWISMKILKAICLKRKISELDLIVILIFLAWLGHIWTPMEPCPSLDSRKASLIFSSLLHGGWNSHYTAQTLCNYLYNEMMKISSIIIGHAFLSHTHGTTFFLQLHLDYKIQETIGTPRDVQPSFLAQYKQLKT